MSATPNVKVGRYDSAKKNIFSEDVQVPDPEIRVFTGWIEPDDRAWIIFLGQGGIPALYWGEREESGAIVGEPVVLDAAVAHPNERLIVDAAAELP